MTIDCIEKSYKDKDYGLTLEYINEYLNEKDAVLTDSLALKYIYSLLFLDELDKAYEKVNEMKLKHPDWISDYKMASIYVQCGKLEEAKDILNSIEISKYQAFDMAKQLYFYGLYDEAKEYFLLAKRIGLPDKNLNSECNYFTKRIKYHNRKTEFIEMPYTNFKLYNKLMPGYIVLANNSTESDKYNSAKKGMYLIWRNHPGELFSFPLSSNIDEEHKTKEKAFIIDSSKHTNLQKDRRIKNITVPLSEDDIISILGRLSKYEYKYAIRNIYKKFAFISSPEHRKKNEQFINFYREVVIQIEKGNNIIVVNKENGNLDYYKVLEFDEETHSYTAQKLQNNGEEYIETNDIEVLGVESNILDKVNIYNKEQTSTIDHPKQKSLQFNNK